jgi:hypothetical protein
MTNPIWITVDDVDGNIFEGHQGHWADDGFFCGPHYYTNITGPEVIRAVNDFAEAKSLRLEVHAESSIWTLRRDVL